MRPLIKKQDLENVKAAVHYIVSRKLAKYRTESLLLWKIRAIEKLSTEELIEEHRKIWDQRRKR